MYFKTLALLAGVSSSVIVSAQTSSTSSIDPSQVKSETVVVLGSATPVPLAESPSAVLILPLRENALTLATPLDPLRSDSSIFLEQRGAGGAQTDLTLRGGSFEQTLVLLNGFRINDSQAAHHNLDLPVPLEAMDSIQVLHGAGSTLHGTDALSGAVDFLTAAPHADMLQLNAGFGSFGGSEQSLLAELSRHSWSSRLTGSHNLSTGFTTDRDYRNETASNEDWVGSDWALPICSSLRATGLSEPISFMETILHGSGRRAGLQEFGRSWEPKPRLHSPIAGTRTNTCWCATILRYTKTITWTGPGRHPCATPCRLRPPLCC